MIPAPDDFVEVCRRGDREARRRGHRVLVSWSVPVRTDRRHLFDDLIGEVEGHDRAFVWASRWSGRSLLASGSAIEFHGLGDNRMEDVDQAWRRCVTSAVADGRLRTGTGPLLVGGFAFRAAARQPGGLPDGLMWVPAVQLSWDDPAGPVLTLNASVDPGGGWAHLARQRVEAAVRLLNAATSVTPPGGPADAAAAVEETPSARAWQRLVGDALGEIGAGEFSKVVLARQVILRAGSALSAALSLRFLTARQLTGAVFGVGLDGRWFLGSSPECLVRVEGGQVLSHGLAGSAPRGADAHQDALLAGRLLADPKNGREHAVVAEFVERVLRDVCTEVETGTDERVLKLADIQHLQTSVRGTLPDGHSTSLLALAQRLHPTPAVAGFPRGPALEWLDRHEPFDRGWYAGPVGWTAADGTGELTVAIRSALLSDNTATVYAGCGIVTGSDPRDEYRESCLKMRPMLTALGREAEAGRFGVAT